MKKLHIIALLLCICTCGWADTAVGKASLSGKVTDDIDKMPLIGVSIYFPELKEGTITNENGEPELSEIVDEGCWGKIQTKAGTPEIYVNNGFYPQCYAAAWNDGKQIMIGMDLE